MKSKDEIQKPRQNWLDKIKECNDIFDKLDNALKNNNYSENEETKRLSESHSRSWNELGHALDEYHKACINYLEEVLKEILPSMREYCRGSFYQNTYNTNDWDNAIDDLIKNSSRFKNFP